MPTENERKYVLDPAHFPGQMRQPVLDFPCSVIYQGYLSHDEYSNLRVRKCHVAGASKSKYMMTYKLNTLDRVVEIDTQIDERDFLDMWGYCKETLRKTRYFVDGWDVDFFLDLMDRVYFILAECEMPEGQDEPASMPDLVAKSLIYEVPRDDERFSSRKLADIPNARKLMRRVLQKARQDDHDTDCRSHDNHTAHV